MKTYENIIATSPEFQRDAYSKIAEFYKTTKDYTQAIDAYRNALSTNQKSSNLTRVELQFLIGDTYEIINDPTKAIEEYLKIPYLYVKDTPWIVKAYLRIARIFENQEKWNKAQLTYNKIILHNTEEKKFALETPQLDKGQY